MVYPYKTKLLKFTHTFLFWCIPFFVLGQVQTDIVYDEELIDSNFIEHHFNGGFEGYADFFENNLVFPEESYKNQTEGLLLFNYTVYPKEKRVEVEFLTHLDQRIESNVREVIKLSISKWKPAEASSYTIYQSIVFSLLPYYVQTLEGDLPELPADLPLKFIQPFIFIKSKRIPKKVDESLLEAKDATEKEKQGYLYSQEMYQRMLELDKPDLAYEFLTVLIRYNPLKMDYLLDRIKLENKLGKRKYQAYDARLLADFVDGYKKEQDYDQMLNEYQIKRLEQRIKTEAIKKGVDSVYTGGYKEYLRRFEAGFHAQDLKKIKSEGAVLFETKVTSGGDILVNFLSRLDDNTQNVIIAAIRNSMNYWDSSISDYSYLQVVFINNSSLYEDQLKGKAEGFPEFPMDHPFLPEISLLTSNSVKNGKENEPVDYLQKYTDLVEEYERAKSVENEKQSYEVLNQIIELNPFNQAYIMERMNLELKLGKETYQLYDQNWLRVFGELAAARGRND